MFATLHCCFVAFLLFLNCCSSKNGVVNVFKNRMDWNGTERKGLQTHQAKNGNEIRKKKWTHKICIKLSFEHFFCFLFAVLLFLLSLLLLLVSFSPLLYEQRFWNLCKIVYFFLAISFALFALLTHFTLSLNSLERNKTHIH